MPSLHWTPSNIGTNLILAETRVVGPHLCRWRYRSIFIKIFTVSSERRTCFETQRMMTLQGHPRSLILVPIESLCVTSYSTSIVTLVLSCRISKILEVLYTESHFFSTRPYSGENFRMFPRSRPVMFGLRTCERAGLAEGEIIFEDFRPVFADVTDDGQTDRHTVTPI